MASQEEQWEEHVAQSREKGLCEFSGKDIVDCQKTICDCFETPEGAAVIKKAAKA